MNTKIKVLIADDSLEFRTLLKGRLEQEPSIAVVGLAADGIQLVSMTESLLPDVIISDTVLSKLDGLAALRQINQLSFHKRPVIFLLSSFTSPQIAAEATSLRADYFIPKPCDISMLIQRITSWKQPAAPEAEIRLMITQAIHDLGVPAHILGHLYLREAILFTIRDSNIAITKQLYPAVAQQFGATGARVERAIRHAIQSAWNRCDQQMMEQYFGRTISNRRGKPTNSEFISMIADRLRLQLLGA